MSRVGLNPINLPEGVTVSVQGTNINVKGPKGELNQKFDPDFKIQVLTIIYLPSKGPSEIKSTSLFMVYTDL